MIREESSRLGMAEHTALDRTKIIWELLAVWNDIERQQLSNSLVENMELLAVWNDIERQQLSNSLVENMKQQFVRLEKEKELQAAWTDIGRQQLSNSLVENMKQQFVLLEKEKELLAVLTDNERELLAAWTDIKRIIRHRAFPTTCSISCYFVNKIAPMSPLSDRSHYYEPSFTTTEIRNLILERIAFFEKDQRLTAREKGCKDQIVKDDVTSSQYDYFGRQTAKIIDNVNAMTNEISPMHQRANKTDTSRQNDFSKRPTASIKDGVMLLQDEIRGNNQIPEANRIAKQKICIEETAGRMIDVVNDLADEIRRKGMIGIENIQLELDIIRKSTANLKGTVKALIEEKRQEHHIVDDGDIAEELGYILWLIAELMGALKRLRTAMRQNQLYLKPVGTKRKPNIVVIKREVSGDDALQRLKKTKHIVTYDLAGEKRPTYGNLSAVLCELCINENEAVNWCETCNSNICVSCTCFHKDVRMMMKHRIFNLP